jgi:hypothetical protein
MLPEERRYSELFEPLTTGDSRIFDPAGEPIRFGDDSQLRVYGRRGALTAAVTRALEQLGAESLPAAARVAVLSRHPFVKCVTNEIGGCALRRRFRLDVPDDFAHGDDRGSVLTEWAMRFLTCENFVVVRVGPSETVPPVEQEWMACLTPLARGSVPIFQTPHPPIPLPDGSSLVVLTRNEGLVQEVADVAKRIADSRHENGSVFVAAVGETAVVELVRQACHEVCLPRQWALHAFPSIADFRDGTAARSVSDHRNLRADWKRANFLVVCQDPGAVDSVSRLSRDLVGPMIDGPTRAFELDRGSSPIGTATVPSAAVAALFRPLPAVEWVDGAPSGWKAADASFEPPAGEESPVKLVAYEVYAADRWLRVDLALSTTTGQGRLPVMVLHFRDAAGVDVESIVLEPLGRGRPAGTDSREAFVVTRGFVACHGLDWRRPGPYSVDVKATSPGTWKDWTGRASLRLPDLGDAK